MASEAKTKQHGLKITVTYYLLLGSQKEVSRGEMDWNGFFKGRYHQFWSKHANMSKALRVAPKDAQIQAYFPDDGTAVRNVAGI